MGLHSLRQSLRREPLFLPLGLRLFQGAFPPLRYPRYKQSFIGTCLTGSHGNTAGLPNPSLLAETTNLPSNFIYRPPPPLPGGSPSHEPPFPPCPAPPPLTCPARRSSPPAATLPVAAPGGPGGGSRRRLTAGLGPAPPAAPAQERSCSRRPGRDQRLPPPRSRQAPPGQRDGPFPRLFPRPGRLPGRAAAPGNPPGPPAARRGRCLPRSPAAAGERPRSPRRPSGGSFSGRGRDPAPHAAPGSASARPLPRRGRSPAAAACVPQQAHPNAARQAGRRRRFGFGQARPHR